MGDVGSLAIGAGVAGLALTMNIPLLIGVLGAVYALQGVATILVRFWILNGLAGGLALMAFYADAISALSRR